MAKHTSRKVSSLLQKHRKISGLNQKQVAYILGTFPSVVSDWEQGKSIPNPLNLCKLAVLYQTMVDTLCMDLIHHLRQEMKLRIKKASKRVKL